VETRLSTSVSTAGAGQSGAAIATRPAPTAEQRRALIDKRLNDLRRSLAAEQSPASASASASVGASATVSATASKATISAAHPKSRQSGAAVVASSGNGATARDLPARSGDDVVARRLRKAAEQETDPVLKRKLWQEYADYPKNVSGK
jgi:hypothetical protein